MSSVDPVSASLQSASVQPSSQRADSASLLQRIRDTVSPSLSKEQEARFSHSRRRVGSLLSVLNQQQIVSLIIRFDATAVASMVHRLSSSTLAGIVRHDQALEGVVKVLRVDRYPKFLSCLESERLETVVRFCLEHEEFPRSLSAFVEAIPPQKLPSIAASQQPALKARLLSVLQTRDKIREFVADLHFPQDCALLDQLGLERLEMVLEEAGENGYELVRSLPSSSLDQVDIPEEIDEKTSLLAVVKALHEESSGDVIFHYGQMTDQQLRYIFLLGGEKRCKEAFSQIETYRLIDLMKQMTAPQMEQVVSELNVEDILLIINRLPRQIFSVCGRSFARRLALRQFKALDLEVFAALAPKIKSTNAKVYTRAVAELKSSGSSEPNFGRIPETVVGIAAYSKEHRDFIRDHLERLTLLQLKRVAVVMPIGLRRNSFSKLTPIQKKAVLDVFALNHYYLKANPQKVVQDAQLCYEKLMSIGTRASIDSMQSRTLRHLNRLVEMMSPYFDFDPHFDQQLSECTTPKELYCFAEKLQQKFKQLEILLSDSSDQRTTSDTTAGSDAADGDATSSSK